MYEAFYGLSSKPFQLNPDPDFYFASKQHRRAKAYLESVSYTHLDVYKRQELNRSHLLITNLSALTTAQPDSPLIGLAIEQLYAGALLQEGLHPNPVEMLPRIEELLTFAATAAAPAAPPATTGDGS